MFVFVKPLSLLYCSNFYPAVLIRRFWNPRCPLSSTNLSVAAERRSRYACTPSAIASRKFENAVLEVIPAVPSLSGYGRVIDIVPRCSCFFTTTGISAGSRLQQLRCGRGTVCTFASTTFSMFVVIRVTLPARTLGVLNAIQCEEPTTRGMKGVGRYGRVC